jgi:chemotaxis signal transduction protein
MNAAATSSDLPPGAAEHAGGVPTLGTQIPGVTASAAIDRTDTLAEVEPVPQGSVRYLSVGVCGRRFAIPLDQVIGVVESAEVTPIPFSPPPFEGLVQAMGQVVPQISLASLLGLPPVEGGILVVASDLGGSVALRVEHVYAMLQIDREKLILAGPDQRSAEPMVLGQFGDGMMTCAVLSMEQLTAGELAETAGEFGCVLLAPDNAVSVKDDRTAAKQAEPYLMISAATSVLRWTPRIAETASSVPSWVLWRPPPTSPTAWNDDVIR